MDLRNGVLCLISTIVLFTGNFVEGEVCYHTLYGQGDILVYPANAENYTNNLNCTWIFIAPTWLVVQITFLYIDLQPMYRDVCNDVMTAYDGTPGLNPLAPPFCGDGPSWPLTPHRFLSTSNKLSLTLVTDGTATATGFIVHYKHVTFWRESIAAINVDVPSIIQFNRFAASLFDDIPLLQSTHPSALDFNPITEFFYYTDIDVGFIGRIKYDGSLDEMLIEENVQTPLGIAVGYLTGLLYWTDFGRQEVGVSRLDGTFRKTLVFNDTDCNSPKAIKLSADQQNVFWICDQKILKAKADCSEIQILVDGLHHPTAIVLDAEMFLYWVDVGTSSMSRIKTNGTMEQELFKHDIVFGVHSFVLDSFAYFWSRPYHKHLMVLGRQNPGEFRRFFARNGVTMGGLYYYKSNKEIAPQHPCATDRAGCQELCFPEGLGVRCVEADATQTTTSATTPSSESRNPSIDLPLPKYIIYIILGVIVAVLCVIVLIVVGITCCFGCCKCSYRPQMQTPTNTASPIYTDITEYETVAYNTMYMDTEEYDNKVAYNTMYMDTSEYDKKVAYNMSLVGSGMGHVYFNNRRAY